MSWPVTFAVVIASPDHEHAAAAHEFARLGYHVLLEKPTAPPRDECIQVVRAAEAAGVVFTVCHDMRYTAYTNAVRDVIADGQLGPPGATTQQGPSLFQAPDAPPGTSS